MAISWWGRVGRLAENASRREFASLRLASRAGPLAFSSQGTVAKHRRRALAALAKERMIPYSAEPEPGGGTSIAAPLHTAFGERAGEKLFKRGWNSCSRPGLMRRVNGDVNWLCARSHIRKEGECSGEVVNVPGHPPMHVAAGQEMNVRRLEADVP